MLEEEYIRRRRLPPHLRPGATREAPFSYSIRSATLQDLPYIREIYNHYVRNSSVTFDDTPWSHAELRRMFARITEKNLPMIVAVNDGGQVLGFAYVHPWSSKAAFRHSVENFIYLGPASTGKGLGKAMLAELIDRARAAGLKEMIAVIADKGADASIALHTEFGFKETGHRGKVGFKFDRWLGSVFMTKSLK